ncbi:protein of unknown function [Sphingomonas guangdongensis]|uniref:Deacetylase PdaC domain-containing protein n=1 Tax=Sphingomonas guangdongensis TaxID=1141890 RepID=A0A285R0X1_9SPHN|nr:DUF4163 domain-containing protein [Sphingomonas guangdongensis]SOB87438.1 protein of unknown function [Sphingomonas guangdongensis]
MRRLPPALTATLLLAGCGSADWESGNASPNGNVVAETPLPPLPTPTPTPSPSPVTASVAEETEDYEFSYSFPSAAAAIPGLAAWFEADRARARAQVAKESAAFRAEREADDTPFRKYTTSVAWSVVADTPRLLSLSALTNDYTGGAHGSPGFGALVWDKTAGRRLKPTALFQSEAALQEALGADFCTALDAERAKRRGEPVDRASGDMFDECPRVNEATLILGSRSKRAIDRVGLLVGPYVAGSYAEGSYDLTFPITPALLAAVKPAYRDAFAAP